MTKVCLEVQAVGNYAQDYKWVRQDWCANLWTFTAQRKTRAVCPGLNVPLAGKLRRCQRGLRSLVNQQNSTGCNTAQDHPQCCSRKPTTHSAGGRTALRRRSGVRNRCRVAFSHRLRTAAVGNFHRTMQSGNHHLAATTDHPIAGARLRRGSNLQPLHLGFHSLVGGNHGRTRAQPHRVTLVHQGRQRANHDGAAFSRQSHGAVGRSLNAVTGEHRR